MSNISSLTSTVRVAFRPIETGLLASVAIIIVWAMVVLSMAQQTPLAPNVALVMPILAMMVGVNLLFTWRLSQADQFLLPLTYILVGLGFVMIHRLEPDTLHNLLTDYSWRQLIGISVGSLLLLIVALTIPSYRRLAHHKYSLALLGFALIVGTKFFGVDPYNEGYKRWFGYHGFYYQPVELLKILTVIFFAAYLDEKREVLRHGYLRLGRLNLPPLQYLAPLFTVWILALGLLLFQNDLGSALVFFGIFLVMIYSASDRISYPLAGVVLIIVGAVVAYHINSHVRARIVIWKDPWSYVHKNVPGTFVNSGQVVQGLIALASGGIIGTGLGQGSPGLIPVPLSDFIFNAIGEELGLCGAMFVLACYLIFAYRGLRIAALAAEGFDKLLVIGLTTAVVGQAFIIIGGNIRVLPIAGVTLPFVSYGPSSLLSNFTILGMLLRISANAKKGDENGSKN